MTNKIPIIGVPVHNLFQLMSSFFNSRVSAIFKMLLETVRKQFRFYYAKACFRMSSERDNDVEKMRYLHLGLKSYNQAIRRNLKLQIKEIEEIYRKIVFAPEQEKKDLVECLSKTGDDILEPIRKLSWFLKVLHPEELLMREENLAKIRELTPFLAAVVIAIAVVIIQVLTFFEIL